jgi:hypothetical protein
MRNTPFQEKNAVEYGLEISTRDPETKTVTSVMCPFCRFFGREEAKAFVCHEELQVPLPSCFVQAAP